MSRVGIGKFGIVGIGLIGILATGRSLSLPLEHRSSGGRLEQRRIERSPQEQLEQPSLKQPPIEQPPTQQRPIEKITFDLSTISAEGLATATGGGSVSYEFCIPATEVHVAAVQAIDPSVKTFARSRGRIGCQREEYLCIGDTHQNHWREKLMALASLNYIQRIDRFWGE